MTILGQRIRLKPNNVQRTWLEQCAGTARFAFNWGLDRWKKQYAAGSKPNWWTLNSELNAIKRSEFPWMTELPWAVTNQALADLGVSFSNFFRRVAQGSKTPGYPKHKKKGKCREGFAIESRALRFENRYVRVPKLGRIRLQGSLRFPGKILSARFSKHANHWYVSIQTEITDPSWVYSNCCESQAVVGVDLGVRDLAVLSTGKKIKAPRALRTLESRLRMLNKELSRRKSRGRNREKTRIKISALHERIACIRRDVTHKFTAWLVRNYRFIGVETLSVKGMLRDRHISKSVADAAMAEVLRQVSYKAALSGSTVIKADRWFPSSKTCSFCGTVRTVLPRGTRNWICEHCGALLDRDVNAARNLKALAATHAVTACCPESADSTCIGGVKLLVGQESSSCVNC